jgi:hypothetical protein
MQTFTGWQYLLIDLANHYGLDGLRFEERLKWAEDHLNQLERMYDTCKAKTLPLFKKTVLSVRKAQQGKPSGHLVGFDAICSGMQIMSVVTGCYSGAKATGLIDPNVRSDAYMTVAEHMEYILQTPQGLDRAAIKDATMTKLYGSIKQPQTLFGKDTPELEAFYKAMWEVAPGAMQLLTVLVDSWNPSTLAHSWRMPDNHYVYLPVMETEESRIEVDELDHSTFTYAFKTNETQDRGVSNAANAIHSIDAWLLRGLERRCNYDTGSMVNAFELIQGELLRRHISGQLSELEVTEEEEACIETINTRFEASKIADLVYVTDLTSTVVKGISTQCLEELLQLINESLVHDPFPILSVHDEYKCHPNNMNHLRTHYLQIMKQLARGSIMEDIVSQLHGMQAPTINKQDLSKYLDKANYFIC